MADPRGSHRRDGGGLRASEGAARRQRWRRQERAGGQHFRGAGTGGHFRGAGTGESEAPSGLDGTSRDDGERRGGISYSSSVSQSIKSPSMSSSHRCRISSPSATVQGAELHSALTPSTAASLVVGIVAGSRTWSDVLGSTSEAILCSVARLCAGSRREMALRHRWARADAPYRREMVDWALGQEWIWRDHPRRRWWVAIRYSPESTPRRRRNLLEDHLRTTALC